MRILFCGINYAPDLIGVPKYNTELCESLTENSHDVRVVTAPPYYPDWRIPPKYRKKWYNSEQISGVAIKRAPIYVPSAPSGSKRILHHASFAASSAPVVYGIALRWRPQLVFAVAPSLLSAPVAAYAARLVGAMSWLHVQDLEIDAAFKLRLLKKSPLWRIMLAVERKILHAFDRVSTISPQMIERLEYKGIDPSKLRQVRNWIDISAVASGTRLTKLRTELGLDVSHTVILYSGAMSKKQGLDIILKAARQVRDSYPKLQFVLCGNGPDRPELVANATGLINIHFLNLQPAERLGELLSTADIHLLPQKAEAADLVLPSKLGGMLASGRPTIAMARPGTGIAQEMESAGLIVPPGDARALTAAIVTLAQDGKLRDQLGTAGRRRCSELWDRNAIIRMLEAEFVSLFREYAS